MVIEGDAVTVHDLPAHGSLLAGRGTEVDIELKDPGASAHHARVYSDGGQVAIEDLGSRNGTQIRGQRISAGERVPLAIGEAALAAGAVLLVQRKSPRLHQRRSLPHGYFELRLGEECQLAGDDGGAAFSIVRMDVNGELDGDGFANAAGDLLRPSDILGTYAPGAYEILLRRTAPGEGPRLLEPLLQKLRELGAAPRASFAHFPADGRTAHALIEKACAGVRPPVVSAAPPGEIVLDARMREVYRLAEKAAGRDINVLILGETGVGKEILAETIHRASRRAAQPFLCLNCGALSESLRESELFGYERGAFTDAKAAKPGLLEMAGGGTVFLDEIGEMAPTMQAMLLRAIETKQVMRIGGIQPKSIDVRFISATHRDLVREIREKRFRSDLYYRLNGIALEIPPLRERRSEIRVMADAFLTQLAGLPAGSRPPRVTDESAALLESYVWDGNIRELRNVMERALLLSDGGDVEPEHLPLETIRGPAEPEPVVLDDIPDEMSSDSPWTPEECAERARVLNALRTEGGNQDPRCPPARDLAKHSACAPGGLRSPAAAEASSMNARKVYLVAAVVPRDSRAAACRRAPVTCSDGRVCPAGDVVAAPPPLRGASRPVSLPPAQVSSTGRPARRRGFPASARLASASRFFVAMASRTASKPVGRHRPRQTRRLDFNFTGAAGAQSATRAARFDTSGCRGLCGDGVRTGVRSLRPGVNLGTPAATRALSLGFYRQTTGLRCNTDCTFDTSGFTAPAASKIVNGTEECDGAPTRSCIDLGFDYGFAGCSASCRVTSDGCAKVGGWQVVMTADTSSLFRGFDLVWGSGPYDVYAVGGATVLHWGWKRVVCHDARDRPPSCPVRVLPCGGSGPADVYASELIEYRAGRLSLGRLWDGPPRSSAGCQPLSGAVARMTSSPSERASTTGMGRAGR